MKQTIPFIILVVFLVIFLLGIVSIFPWLPQGKLCPRSINRMPRIYSGQTAMTIGGIRQNLQDWYLQSFCQGKTEVIW